jgi:hypothetical protein
LDSVRSAVRFHIRFHFAANSQRHSFFEVLMKTLEPVSNRWTRNRFALSLACLGLAAFGLAANAQTASASLIAYYPLNGNLHDASGNGNNGTAGPDLTFGNGGITSTGTDANQYFTSPVNINLLPQVTFGGWFETTSTNPVRGLIANDTGGFGRGIDIDNRGSGNGYSAFNGAGVFGGSILPTGAPTFDFVAVTYNSVTNTQTLDVNGTFVTSTGSSPPAGQNVLTIGKNPSFDMPFGGTIKDVFIYNTALTPSQLNAIQTNGLPEPSSFVLGGLGVVGLLLAARRRRKA